MFTTTTSTTAIKKCIESSRVIIFFYREKRYSPFQLTLPTVPFDDINFQANNSKDVSLWYSYQAKSNFHKDEISPADFKFIYHISMFYFNHYNVTLPHAIKNSPRQYTTYKANYFHNSFRSNSVLISHYLLLSNREWGRYGKISNWGLAVLTER